MRRWGRSRCSSRKARRSWISSAPCRWAKGCNNALTLFWITQIPSDNQIRNLLDPVPPTALLPIFAAVVEVLHHDGHLEPYRCIGGDLLVAMDGTQYFSSTKIHCPQCSVTEHANGSVTYSHSVVTPVIVAPGNPRVLPLEPEFIVPQDGHKKQDRETAAAKRWLAKFGARYRLLGITMAMTSTVGSRCAKPSFRKR